jgi:CheY-like chemotaxis protein
MLLAATRRRLRFGLPEADVVYCESGLEALDKMNADKFDMVFSDVRMPTMDGVELLTHISHSYPDTCRFAMTGQSEQSQLERIFQYAHQVFGKPFETDTLKEIVRKCVVLRDRIPYDDFRQAISGLILHPSWIDSDQINHMALVVARLSGIASSSFFKSPQSAVWWEQIVQYMGFEMIQKLFTGSRFEADASQSAARFAEIWRLVLADQSRLCTPDHQAYQSKGELCVMCLANQVGQALLDSSTSIHDLQANFDSNGSLSLDAIRFNSGKYALFLWGFPPSPDASLRSTE